MKSPYSQIKEFRDLLFANMNFPQQFINALNQCENIDPVLKDRFTSMLQFVRYNVTRFNESTYRFLGFKGDPMVAGLNLSRILSVNVDKYRVFNLAVVMRKISVSDESVSCKVTYKDGSSQSFQKILNIEKNDWRSTCLNNRLQRILSNLRFGLRYTVEYTRGKFMVELWLCYLRME